MTADEQKQFLINLCDQTRDHLLSRADRWPENWDGHELRELIAIAFDFERSALIRETRSRRRQRCHTDINRLGLY